MEPTTPTDNNPNQLQETPEDKSNVQSRIDQLVAEREAERKRAEEATNQVAQLTATVAKMIESQAKPVAQPQEQLPEGVDPSLAKFFMAQIESVKKSAQEQAQQMFWQMQHQLDQRDVNSQYAHLPEDIRKDAASRLTGLKQQYPGATMEDAMALAYWNAAKKAGMQNQAQQFNRIGQPMTMQSPMPQPQQTNTLVSPASRPDWDSLPEQVQWKLIDEYTAKGGKLMG